MIDEVMIKKLEEYGFKRWTFKSYDRLYFNPKTIMKIEYYKSGNISDAFIDSERISNSAARRILSSKYFVDIKSENINCDKATDDYKEYIKEYIKEMISSVR